MIFQSSTKTPYQFINFYQISVFAAAFSKKAAVCLSSRQRQKKQARQGRRKRPAEAYFRYAAQGARSGNAVLRRLFCC